MLSKVVQVRNRDQSNSSNQTSIPLASERNKGEKEKNVAEGKKEKKQKKQRKIQRKSLK